GVSQVSIVPLDTEPAEKVSFISPTCVLKMYQCAYPVLSTVVDCEVTEGSGPSSSVITPGPLVVSWICWPDRIFPLESVAVAQMRFTSVPGSRSAGSQP